MKTVVNFLKGKKAYIVASLMVLISLVNLVTGDMSLMDFLNSPDIFLLLNGAGLASMRAAISKRV